MDGDGTKDKTEGVESTTERLCITDAVIDPRPGVAEVRALMMSTIRIQITDGFYNSKINANSN